MIPEVPTSVLAWFFMYTLMLFSVTICTSTLNVTLKIVQMVLLNFVLISTPFKFVLVKFEIWNQKVPFHLNI